MAIRVFLFLSINLISLTSFCQRAQVNELITKIELHEDNNVDSALFYTGQLISTLDEASDSVKLESYFLAARMYDDAALHDIAFEYFEKTLGLMNESDPRIGIVYSEIGELFTSFEDFEKARYYLNQASRLLDDQQSTEVKALLFYDWGTFYWYIEQYDSATSTLEKASQLFASIKPIDFNYLKIINCELAEVYCYNGQLSKADSLFSLVSQYPDTVTYTMYSDNYYSYSKGLTYKYKNQYVASINLLEEVLSNIQNLQSESVNIIEHLVEIYAAMGKFETALGYQQKRDLLLQQIINDRNKRRIAALEIMHETEKKDQTILTQKETIANRTILIIFAAISIALISVFTVLQFRARRAIQSKNEKIETLMRELHHRVKNNLQVISSLLGLQSMKLNDPSAKRAIEEGKDRVKAMSLIHQRLYSGSEVSKIDFSEYATNLIEELKKSYSNDSEMNLKISIPKVELDVDKTLPLGLILNELVTNSFKYAFSKTEILTLQVSLTIENSHAELVVSDNGTGLPENLDIAKAESFGLKLVDILVNQLKGKIAIFSNQGLTFKITFEI